MQKVSLTDIQHALSDNAVRLFQLVHFAIMAGVTTFFLIVIFMYYFNQGKNETSGVGIETINMLSIIHLLLFITSLKLSGLFYNTTLQQIRVESMLEKSAAMGAQNPADSYIAILRTAKIIKLAVLEAPVFVGLVTCFIGVTNNILHQHPYYWINACSYFIFMYLVIKDFPNREKLLNILKDKFKYLLEY